MNTMKSFIATTDQNTDGFLGYLLYYSISGVLVPREKLIKVGEDMGLTKVKPARESKSNAYRKATTAIKDRIVLKTPYNTNIYRVYCRDNKKEDTNYLRRQLVKETLDGTENHFQKVASIVFDKETENMLIEDMEYDPDIDVEHYCQEALEYYKKYQDCYNPDHIDSIIQNMLYQMQATKISIHANFYFIPASYSGMLSLLEDYIEIVGQLNENQGSGHFTLNTIPVVDSEKQRNKMAKEFYAGFKSDIEFYQQKILNFIQNGCTSKVVINRWLNKIDDLGQKKKLYEDILQQELTAMDEDFAILKMQADELGLRATDHQVKFSDLRKTA